MVLSSPCVSGTLEIVCAQDVAAVGDEPLAQVLADEARAASDKTRFRLVEVRVAMSGLRGLRHDEAGNIARRRMVIGDR